MKTPKLFLLIVFLLFILFAYQEYSRRSMERSFAIALGHPIINQICQPETASDVGRRRQSSQRAFFGGYQFKVIYTFDSESEARSVMDALEEECQKMRGQLGLRAGLNDGTWTTTDGSLALKAWHLSLERSPNRMEITLEWRRR